MSSRLANRSRKLPPKPFQAIVTQPRVAGLTTPLEHMLAVVNDPAADPVRRDRMARAAAPYCHPRTDSVPKKARQAAEARRAGAGTPWAGDLEWPRQ